MVIYNMIIIGGGLSGIYTAYKYQKKYPKAKILLLECQDRLGGRIYTYEDDIYGKIEAGAARFLPEHKHVIQLIHELNLESHINPIPPDIGYEPIHPINLPHTPKDITNLNKIILKQANKTPREVLQNTIFMDFVKKVLPAPEAQLYYDSFGYTSELTFMNAYDTVELIKNHFISKHFLNLKGGLSQIINKLETKLRTKPNIDIKTKHQVSDIEYNEQDQLFHVESHNKTFQGRSCICTFNKEIVEHFHIFKPIKSYLKYIKNLPLCRIYTKFSLNTETNEPWFNLYSGLTPRIEVKGRHKFTTNNQLRMVIPMNAELGTAMISYSDNHYAKSWYKLYKTKGIDAVNQKLHKLIQESVPNTHIPKPSHTKIFYWEHAVAYYGKGFDSTTMLDKIKQPYPDIPLYLCGENYSEKNNQWMEGALDTVPEFFTPFLFTPT